MKTAHKQHLFAAALGCALALSTTVIQAQTAPKMKMPSLSE